MRDLDITDSELQLVAVLRRAARERGGPLPSIAVADALLDERRELARKGCYKPAAGIFTIPVVSSCERP